MQFSLRTAGYFYTPQKADKLASAFGFTFENSNVLSEATKVIDCSSKQITINSLEELVEFSKVWGPIIISLNKDGSADIEIYDDWRE